MDDLSLYPRLASTYRLMAMAQRRVSLEADVDATMDRLRANPDDAGALLDMSLLLHLGGNADMALSFQAAALERAQIFIEPSPQSRFRLLCFVLPGDLTANMPVELLVEGAGITLIKVYVRPGYPLPLPLPRHDGVLICMGASDAAEEPLERLAVHLADWHCPVINRPEAVARLPRERVSECLQGIEGLAVPLVVRWTQAQCLAAAQVMQLQDFPLVARPVGSHGGKGVELLTEPTDLIRKASESSDDLYLCPFVDYRSTDGHWRKWRVVLTRDDHMPVHLAIGDHWLVHYATAGMEQDPAKRDEERYALDRYATEFGLRHHYALREIARRLDLDYVVLDCAETVDDLLILFEADNGGAVHDLDHAPPFGYKVKPINRIFAAFIRLING